MVDDFNHSLTTEAIDECFTEGLLFGWGPCREGAGV